MNVLLIFFVVVLLYLLPAVPAILFYKLSPKSDISEARTIADYGPISVKLGGSAAMYLAFFFLLNQTPLIDVLKEAANVLNEAASEKLTGKVTLKAHITYHLPNKESYGVVKGAITTPKVIFEPPSSPIIDFEKSTEETSNQVSGTISITVPSSWVKDLRSGTEARLMIDPSSPESLTIPPIFIQKSSFPNEPVLNTSEITLNDIEETVTTK